MIMRHTTTLRPGLLVSLKTSISGNVSYFKQEIEPDHLTRDGKRQAKWETERVISDPKEHEAATRVRSKANSLIRTVCSRSAFGLLCPEIETERLEKAIAEARTLAEEFNATARLTRVSVYVITGRIAPDDVEAVRAINSEICDLLEDMQRGLKNLDVDAVREAANKARNIGAMLSPDAAARVSSAIEVARSAARRIVKAGDQAASEIDRATLRRIEEARTAFLDLDSGSKVERPVVEGRALDLSPSRSVRKAGEPTRMMEL